MIFYPDSANIHKIINTLLQIASFFIYSTVKSFELIFYFCFDIIIKTKQDENFCYDDYGAFIY